MKVVVAAMAAILVSGCATNKDGTTSFGMVESQAWFDTASRNTIESHFDAMEVSDLCIRWAETKSSVVRKEIAGSLKRRGLNPLLCY